MRIVTPRRILLVVCLLAVSLTSLSSAQAANRRGVKAPEIAITEGIHGVTAKTKLADYKGSPTIVVVWIPICPNCKRFLPTLHRLHKTYGPRGLKVLTVTHGKVDYTRRFMAQRKWTFGVGFDWSGITSKRYGVRGLPGVFLVGADGHFRHYRGSLEAAVKEELGIR